MDEWTRNGVLVMPVPKLASRVVCGQFYWRFQKFMRARAERAKSCTDKDSQSMLATEFCSNCVRVRCDTGDV